MSVSRSLEKSADNELIFINKKQYLDEESLRPRSISPIDLKHLNKLLKLSSSNLKKAASGKTSPVELDNGENRGEDEDEDVNVTLPTIITPTASPTLGVAS